ncbi:MAG: hypothetical protein US51_C0047G0002 [Microgenomates group bacterium GW2011_GWA2_37_6]|nr:MAG: hypothetical protein US51_C0047G0002 [Microgenomates group bacterium GW2011_GWA2_37_6]
MYEGFQGLKNAFETIANEFEKNEEFLVLGVDKTLTPQQLNFFIQYHQRKIKAKIVTKVIFTSNLRGIKEYHPRQNKYNEERYFNQISAVPINVYKDFVLIPLFEKNQKETTILIHNKILADGFRQYFYTLWKISKP